MEPPLTKGARLEGSQSDIEGTLRRRARSHWPTQGFSTDPSKRQGLSVGSYLYAHHDGPHCDSKIEWWYVNGHVGDDETTSVFAAFFRLATWDEASASVRYAHAANWAISNSNKKSYSTCSLLDPSTPSLLTNLINTNEYQGDPFVLAALKEIFAVGKVLEPDRFMSTEATVSGVNEPLHLDFGGNVFRRVVCPPLSNSVEHSSTSSLGIAEEHHILPKYELILKSDKGATVFQCVLRATQPAALSGVEGIVSVGHWTDDMFYYFTPHCELESGSIGDTSGSTTSTQSLSSGRFWVDHEFGGCVPSSKAEAAYLRSIAARQTSAVDHSWEWAALRLNNDTRDAIAVTVLRDMKRQGAVVDMFAVLQEGTTGVSTYYGKESGLSFASVATKPKWKSPATGLSFPTAWSISIPHHTRGVLAISATVDFPEQEFVTLPGKPSYWEGRIRLSATQHAKGSSATPASSMQGIGFMECHGEQDLHSVAQSFGLMHALLCAPLEAPGVQPAAVPLTMPAAEASVSGSVEQACAMIGAISGVVVPPLHRLLLRALLACFSVMRHHGADRVRVDEAVAILESHWKEAIVSSPITFHTLVLRAFTLRTIDYARNTFCPPVSAESDNSKEAQSSPKEVMPADTLELVVPSFTELTTPATAADMSSVTILASGSWVLDGGKAKEGSLSDFLAAQGVNMVVRMLCASLTPELRTTVDEANKSIQTDVIVSLGTTKSVVKLNGQPWQWDSAGRGLLTSRACVRVARGGSAAMLTLVTEVPSAPNGSIEVKWIVFSRDGAMQETMHLLPKEALQNGQPRKPIVAFTQYFKKKS